MTNYYFLATLLPDLQIGVPPEIDFYEFAELLKMNLSKADFEKVQTIQRYYDIQNVRSFWREETLSHRGSFDEKELEEAFLTKSGLPEYVYDFEERYDSKNDRLHHFASLISSYFDEEIPKATGFLREYLEFERGLRLVLTGLRSKLLKRDIMTELQYENSDDNIVAQLIAQKDSTEYEPPSKFSEVKVLYEENCEKPFQLHKMLAEYRFEKITEMVGAEFFTIDRILAYMVKLIIVEKWLELDKKKGMEIVDTIVKEAS
ncbi:MAG: DUF2764 family protein [Chlamydiota bacterium]|nr:DUF2764 family protein [Chlamydiota bacterium]